MTSLNDDLLPMGNLFSAGSRIRLYILGTPLDQISSLPGINTVPWVE